MKQNKQQKNTDGKGLSNSSLPERLSMGPLPSSHCLCTLLLCIINIQHILTKALLKRLFRLSLRPTMSQLKQLDEKTQWYQNKTAMRFISMADSWIYKQFRHEHDHEVLQRSSSQMVYRHTYLVALTQSLTEVLFKFPNISINRRWTFAFH